MTRAADFALGDAIPHGMAALSALGADPVEGEARAILATIERIRQPRVRLRDIHQTLRKRPGFEKVEKLRRGIELLVARGYLRTVWLQPKSREGKSAGGRPGEGVELNPHLVAEWAE